MPTDTAPVSARERLNGTRVQVPGRAEVARTPVAAAGEAEDAESSARSPAHLDERSLECLLLNLDASLGVHERRHLFTWTQGLLQSLVPHKVLICALRQGDSTSFSYDSLSTLVTEPQMFGDLLWRDVAIAPALMSAWQRNDFLPVLGGAAELLAAADGALAAELQRVDGPELLIHGSHDADSKVRSLFVFACERGSIGGRETYLLQLLAPSLHAAWIRSRTTARTRDAHEAPVGAGVLTEREREILHWIYLGKSNGEIGVILEISPLTVKNHVQKVLRKLNVVNRAQAVGKALEARIITP